MKPGRPDLRPERPDLRPHQPDFRPEQPDLRPERPARPHLGGGTNGLTDGRKNESPPVFYKTSSPSGPPPKKGTDQPANRRTDKAECRVA